MTNISRTKRVYNKPSSFLFKEFTQYDPKMGYLPSYQEYVNRMKYTVVCMGHCPRCRDHKRDQMVRTAKKEFVKFH